MLPPFLFILACLSASSTLHQTALSPSKVSFRQVSQSYPETWVRTLFSSVPRREFAVRDLSIDLEGFWIILGASSSGKSTILRLLAQQEKPISGEIDFQPAPHRSATTTTSRPIYLQEKPRMYYTSSAAPIELIDPQSKELALFLADSMGLDLTKGPSTTSDMYKHELVRASLESMMPFQQSPNNDIHHSSGDGDGQKLQEEQPRYMNGPILLLDEWMDKETSETVQKVEGALESLVRDTGALVVCVTHKPSLFAKPHPTITMCRGQILKRENIRELGQAIQ